MLAGMLEDSRGNLWISSTQNIFRLSLKELNDFADGKICSILPVSYGVAEGMRSSESDVGSPAGWETNDGRMWFPTMRGVVAIDPTAGNHRPPPVVMEEAWANKLRADRATVEIPCTAGRQHIRFPLHGPELLRLRTDCASSTVSNHLTRTGWTPVRTVLRTTRIWMRESTRFTSLAANNFGVWSEQEASVRFVLRPHFYQTNWFRALCAAIFLALLWAAYQFRVRQLA